MAGTKKIRIDQLLVQRGMVESRETAQRLILARKVRIGERFAEKPGQTVPVDAQVELLEELKYVSRGGHKLEAALEAFGIDVTGKVVLDVGASTGGFTQCVLLRGARKVYAIDVGYGQIAWKLREDPRVILIERFNARAMTLEQFADPIDLTVVDVSFIGAAKILEPLAAISPEVVLLLKPQFEAGPEDVPRGGVIRDSRVHARVLQRFFDALTGWQVHGIMDSPIAGTSGNREFLIHLKRDTEGWPAEKIASCIRDLTSDRDRPL